MIQEFVSNWRDILDMFSIKLFAFVFGGAFFSLLTSQEWQWIAWSVTITAGITTIIVNVIRLLTWATQKIIEKNKKKKSNGV